MMFPSLQLHPIHMEHWTTRLVPVCRSFSGHFTRKAATFKVPQRALADSSVDSGFSVSFWEWLRRQSVAGIRQGTFMTMIGDTREVVFSKW